MELINIKKQQLGDKSNISKHKIRASQKQNLRLRLRDPQCPCLEASDADAQLFNQVHCIIQA